MGQYRIARRGGNDATARVVVGEPRIGLVRVWLGTNELRGIGRAVPLAGSRWT